MTTTLPISKVPPMICRRGVPATKLPRFQKTSLPSPGDGEPIEDADISTNYRWAAIRTLANKERQLAYMLQAMQLTYFLPMQRAKLRKRGRNVQGVRLLFPGYLFVLIKPKHRLRILATRRVASIITIDGDHAQAHLQKELRAIAKANRYLTFVRHNTVIDLQPGAPARFIAGTPLQGQECTVLHSTTPPKHGFVWIQLKVAMLGASVFEAEAATLERI